MKNKIITYVLVISSCFVCCSCATLGNVVKTVANIGGSYLTQKGLDYLQDYDPEIRENAQLLADNIFGSEEMAHRAAWENANNYGKVYHGLDDVFDILTVATGKDLSLGKDLLKQNTQYWEAINTDTLQNRALVGAVFYNAKKVKEYVKLNSEKVDELRTTHPDFDDFYDVAEDGGVSLKNSFETTRSLSQKYQQKIQEEEIVYWNSLKDVGESTADDTEQDILAQKASEELRVSGERRKAIQVVETTKLDSYPFDQTSLSPNQQSTLDGVIHILKQYSDLKVCLIGHTCNIGTQSVNYRKGLKRAESAKMYLLKNGISQERITILSKGEQHPLVKNESEENRKTNRRVEFIIES